MDSSIAFQTVAILILIALSSFFSSAETAMTTVNKIRIQSLAEQGNKRAVILEKIISDSPKMLSTVLIGNNIVKYVCFLSHDYTHHKDSGKRICRNHNRHPDSADSHFR